LAIKLSKQNVSEVIRFLKNRIKLVDSPVIFVNYYIKQLQFCLSYCLFRFRQQDIYLERWNGGSSHWGWVAWYSTECFVELQRLSVCRIL